MRLTPSERSTDEPGPTSTEPDTTSGSSDTADVDTDDSTHPCNRVFCLDRPDTRSCADGWLTVVAGDGYCALDTSSAPVCMFDNEQLRCPSGACEGTRHCKDAPCHGVRCDRPPANQCLGGTDDDSDGSHGDRALVYEREGRCQQDGTDSKTSCLYDTRAILDCVSDCDTDTVLGAHCQDEPCRNVVCNQPPARYCADDNTLVVWNLFGRCAGNGTCDYDKRTIDCSGNCKNGRCVGNPCSGMLCYRPPARYCSSAAKVIEHRPVGTCDAVGACVYEEMRRDCLGSDCADGNCGSQGCVDTAFCHTPPAPYCNSESTLVFWDARAECVSGHCAYATNEACEGSCVNGRCSRDPCEGPAWPCTNGAPASYCADDAESVYSFPRGCDPNHPCEYDTATEFCPGGCKAGVCKQTPSPSPNQKAAP